MTSDLSKDAKAVVDRYKPWFDYSSCVLGACAWLFAIGSVAVLSYHSKTDWTDAVFWITNASLIPAFAYWAFLIVSLYRMTRELGLLPPKFIGESGWKYSLYIRLFVFWYVVGMASFVTALISHLAWAALGLYQR